MTPLPRVLLIALCIFSLAPTPAPPSSPAFVTKKPPVIERKTFDPDHLPTPPPPLSEGEAAICVASALCSATFESETLYRNKTATGFEAAVKINSVTAALSLTITLWTPTDAPAYLKEHEEGHRQITERVYATADKVALAAAKNVSGRTFTGTGKTAAAAETDALQQAQKLLMDDYTNHACSVWKRVNEIYDAITAHGTNSAPTRKNPISVKSAIELAFKQYAEESTPKTQPATAVKTP